ncbi:hypothetical protein [Pseudophaeobacter sp. 1A09344]|uniref:hypothetical protein n=1 Tax=Pseudophaeobacter sp. 1A09344 TaxID=3098144 RepID=UPI0034D75DE4
MVKELIIHLGDTKTGSTTLQGVLRSGSYTLPGVQQLLYPGRHLNHNYLAQGLYRKEKKAGNTRRFRKLHQALESSDADFAVVSAEHFQFASPTHLQQVIQETLPGYEHKIRLISYVRPHAEKLLSAFSEQIKFGMVKGGLRGFFNRMSARGTLDYTPRFLEWRNTFGDRFELRPFVRQELFREDISADFFHFLTGEEGTELQGKTVDNPALTVGQIALLQHVHHVFRSEAARQEIDRKLMRRALTALSQAVTQEIKRTGIGKETGRLHIPRSLIGKVIDRYQEDAAALDAAFFTGTPMTEALQAAPQKLSGKKQSFSAADYFDTETLLGVEALSGALSALALHTPEQFQKKMKAAYRQNGNRGSTGGGG